MTKTVRFELERETKGTYRYKEVPEGGQPPAVGTLYVQKWAVPAGTGSLTVTIEAEP